MCMGSSPRTLSAGHGWHRSRGKSPLTLSLSRKGRGGRLCPLRTAFPSPLAGEGTGVRGDFPLSYDALIEQTLDELAAHLAQHIDMEALLKLAR